MQTSTLVILGVIVLLAIVALVLIAARSSRMRHPALRPLSPEAQDRYVSQWDRIEAKFVDSPDRGPGGEIAGARADFGPMGPKRREPGPPVPATRARMARGGSGNRVVAQGQDVQRSRLAIHLEARCGPARGAALRHIHHA